MNLEDESIIYTNTKELPKEYLILQLRMKLNSGLLESKIISLDVFNRMQKYLIKKMDKILLEFKT